MVAPDFRPLASSPGCCGGATVVVGGPGRPAGIDKGFFVRPTVFANVDNQMTIAREEIFGPVLVMIPYKDEEEAVKKAHQVESTAPGKPVPVASAAAVGATLSKSMPGIQNPALKAEASKSAEKIIDTLAGQAAAEPAATKGLETVGLAAAEAKSTELIAVTVQRLDELAKNPSAPQSQAAQAAIQSIRRAAAAPVRK